MYLLSKDSVSYFAMNCFSSKIFPVGFVCLSCVSLSVTGSAAPKVVPPPPPGMGPKGPLFGESF